MKIKTSELTGAALDWAVAMTENWAGADFKVKPYSTDWAQGGPIIEREKIEVCPVHGAWRATPDRSGYPNCETPWFFGQTPLIAAMRCYVASKLGDEVDVPEELCPPTA
jgi:hypothetical protein